MLKPAHSVDSLQLWPFYRLVLASCILVIFVFPTHVCFDRIAFSIIMERFCQFNQPIQYLGFALSPDLFYKVKELYRMVTYVAV